MKTDEAGHARKPCCVPSARVELAASADRPHEARVPETEATRTPASTGRGIAMAAMVRLAGGHFTMGTDAADAVAADGEGPARRVTVDGFSIGIATVTNREFSAFVRATRYVTDAERAGSSFVFYLQVPQETRLQARRIASGLPWWLPVEYASWQRPEGPGTHIHTRPDHPVVHVSWNDCQHYCEWAGARLPSEAQWEFAARGSRESTRFPWGDELQADGFPRCNVWRGAFPDAPAGDWPPAPAPAISHEPNGYGLYNVCGNVWEWCEDWFSPDYHMVTSAVDPRYPRPTGRRSLRGGSFLCHDSYCNRYRVSARSSNTPESSASNIGFRIAGR